MLEHSTFERILATNLGAALNAAAEPLIQKAVAEFEQETRRRFGEAVLSLLSQNYSARWNGSELQISVQFKDRP